MTHRTIGEFVFYFKQESVIMSYRNQYTCFHSFTIRNKHQFQRFSEDVHKARKMDLDRIYHIAKENKIPAMATTSVSIKKNILW